MNTLRKSRLILAAIVLFGTTASGEDRAIHCQTPGPCGATALRAQDEPPNNRDAVFSIRGWDLGRYEPNQVPQWIREAKNHGINVITLSHDIVMDWPQILEDAGRAANIERWCAAGKRNSIEVFLWNHAIEKPPAEFVSGGALDFDNPRLWEWLEGIYHRVIDTVPSTAGIVLSLTEAEWQIHRGLHEPDYMNKRKTIRSELPPEQRMARVIGTLHKALSSRGKKLIVRDFFRTPIEHDLFLKATESLPEDIIIYTKHVPNDFHYAYPPNPTLGKYKNRNQVMEIEPSVPGGADYYKTQYQLARDRGLAGIIPRMRFGDPYRDFNNYCYNKLIHDPDADLEPMGKEYFGKLYGNQEAAEVARRVLKRAFDVRNANTCTLGNWTGNSSKVPLPDYVDSHLEKQGLVLWTDDPKCVEIDRMLREGGAKAVKQSVAEKKWAEEQCLQCLKELEASRPHFQPAQYKEIYELVDKYRKFSRSMAQWARGYFAFRYYRNHSQDPQAKEDVEAALKAIREFIAAERPKDGLGDFAKALQSEIAKIAPRRKTPGA
jgi:hypothetical protein